MIKQPMPSFEKIQGFAADLQTWRRDIHQHPELGFEETRTANLVAEKLQLWGIETLTQIGGTGVVGKLSCGTGDRAIGLRADMDALPMQELNTFEHKSCVDNIFHGCGHDGHTVMLLGAAKYLAEISANDTIPPFNGTVYFIFQPAEEGLGGAKAMIDDGLFDRFPMDAVYGMHNMPGIELGCFAITSGPMMAAFSTFELTLSGRGGHGAMPHCCVDSIVIAAEIIQALQTIVSRDLNPQDTAVLSITKIQAGNAYNVIPNQVDLAGGIRFFYERVGDQIKQRMQKIVKGISLAHGIEALLSFETPFVVLNNSKEETQCATDVVSALFGKANIDNKTTPLLGSEDFCFFLQEKPGAYIFLGNGAAESEPMIHHPNYDFNDRALVYGASYWVELVKYALAGSEV